jgi:hypothetical protein
MVLRSLATSPTTPPSLRRLMSKHRRIQRRTLPRKRLHPTGAYCFPFLYRVSYIYDMDPVISVGREKGKEKGRGKGAGARGAAKGKGAKGKGRARGRGWGGAGSSRCVVRWTTDSALHQQVGMTSQVRTDTQYVLCTSAHLCGKMDLASAHL